MSAPGNTEPIEAGPQYEGKDNEIDTSELLVTGHSPGKHAQADLVSISEEKKSETNDHMSDGAKKEVYGLAERILAAAAEKSSGETEKKLIAAVMAVHMKYAESLQVIEKLIADRKKVDDRVKYLESQLKKGTRKKPDASKECDTVNRMRKKSIKPSLQSEKTLPETKMEPADRL